MHDSRPKNLNLFTIRFPIPAIASILHRVSGVILFLAIPLILCALKSSLMSEQDFNDIHQALDGPIPKFILWALLSSFIFHFVAGIRHLLMDINIGVELKSGRLGAIAVFAIAILLIVLTGIWLW